MVSDRLLKSRVTEPCGVQNPILLARRAAVISSDRSSLRDDALNRYIDIYIDRLFQITPWHYITTSLQKVKVKDFL